jgi:DNA mismatch endonuclease (patch repair protein)
MAKLSRCENISRIRGRDTGPEIRLRKALWRAGMRYRLRYDLPGRPDLTFVGARLAVFVDGCFWHGCPVHYSVCVRCRQVFDRPSSW